MVTSGEKQPQEETLQHNKSNGATFLLRNQMSVDLMDYVASLPHFFLFQVPLLPTDKTEMTLLKYREGARDHQREGQMTSPLVTLISDI